MATIAPPAEERVLAAVDPSARRRRRTAPRDTATASLRFAAFAALVLYGCEHWIRQVAPSPGGVALQMALVPVLLAAGLVLLRRLEPGRRRALVVTAVCLLATVLALTAAGIPLRFVGWRNWGELREGVGEGLSALPNLNIPYRGLNDWVRWVVLSGAALLGVVAAALAFAPGVAAGVPQRRRFVLAALVLGILYGVPVVERNPESPYLSGAGFAVLLALFLGAERLTAVRGVRPRAIAVTGGVLALALGALAAPGLNGGSPWIDYRGLASDLAERNQTAFNWNHSYSPLRWPRDGREVIRVKAKESAYWKATVLRRFDGVRWVQQAVRDPTEVDTPRPANEPGWYEDIEVAVRGLRSEELLTSGYATAITGTPRPALPAGSGTFRSNGRPLRPGDTYAARVYNPKPTVGQMRAAGTAYPEYTERDLTMELPERVGGPVAAPGGPGPDATTVLFPAFGSPQTPVAFVPGQPGLVENAGSLMANSGYARTYAAAQALRAAASDPFDLVRDVRRRVQQDARYTETPRQGRVPLDAFLFDTKEGYCQQFSGAMALMLRMAGVPARVASGFTPGSFDTDRGQYIVRDLDAHSWVEAFFPDYGWVTFDPTPTIAPPASQDSGDGGDSAADSESTGSQAGSDGADAAASATAEEPGGAAVAAQDGSSRLPLALGVLVLVGLAAAGVIWWRRPHTPLTPLEELRRALTRSGRPPENQLTLVELEGALGGTPAAQAYVRKLRLARYAGREEPPSREERAALREELGAGLGLRGRLRALWALPPQALQRH